MGSRHGSRQFFGKDVTEPHRAREREAVSAAFNGSGIIRQIDALRTVAGAGIRLALFWRGAGERGIRILRAFRQNFDFADYLLTGHLVSMGFAGSAVISRAAQ